MNPLTTEELVTKFLNHNLDPKRPSLETSYFDHQKRQDESSRSPKTTNNHHSRLNYGKVSHPILYSGSEIHNHHPAFHAGRKRKKQYERKAHISSITNAVDQNYPMTKPRDPRRDFDVDENLLRSSSTNERTNQRMHDASVHSHKKISFLLDKAKHISKTHHHRRKLHHKHSHHTHHERVTSQTGEKVSPKKHLAPGKDFDPLHVPELEGFVLQEFDAGDFEGERVSLGDAKVAKRGSGLVDKNIHVSRSSSSRKKKYPKKYKKVPQKIKTKKPQGIKVGVKKFKDFDLTVLEVPNLSRDGSSQASLKSPRHHASRIIEGDIMLNDAPAAGNSSSHKPDKHRDFRLSKKRLNEVKNMATKTRNSANEKHHISRRIGDGTEAKMMNTFGTVMGSGLVKKLGDAEVVDVTRDGQIEFGPHAARQTAGYGGQYKAISDSAARSRREEGAPGSPIGAAAAAAALPRSKTAEPLDLDAANVNRHTEMDAEVDDSFANINADILADDEDSADVAMTSSATLSTTASPSTTTFSPDVMPSISCTAADQCSEVAYAVCGAGGTCICSDPTPVYIADISTCLKGAALNTSCLYDEQCLFMEETYGRCGTNKICTCVKGYEVKMHPSVGINCVEHSRPANPVDPTMIGVLVGLALMFVIICVVLRLFSKARFRENRSIFNTPNPRLMNASLFKDSKLLSPSRGERRGSRASVRAPSRTASLASVNAAASPTGKSPNGSLTAKGRRGSGVSVGSGPAVGSPAASAIARTSPTPETPKSAGGPLSPDKIKKEQSAVNIEAVD
ncbi:uncharacterized protein LOC108676354 isoform X2 [Hyalella azteca]|nr:uncharacterized protein LOC108676354 isoform X2 [Hyalella azteca]